MRHNWDFIQAEMARQGITRTDLHVKARLDYDTASKLMMRMLKPFPVTVAKLVNILGCRKSELLTNAPEPKEEDEDDRSIRRCVVCGRPFIPYQTTRRPDGSLSVAGKDYCSFQCCKEANPSFKKKDNRNGLENFQGHGNNFLHRKRL